MKFTAVEQRMFDLLSDGMDHTRHELYACLSDDMAKLEAIRPHLTSIRKKLPDGIDIVCLASSAQGPARYRMVRSLKPRLKEGDLPW